MISRSIYSQIERGRYNVRVSELAAFTDIFGVDYNAFFQSREAVKNNLFILCHSLPQPLDDALSLDSVQHWQRQQDSDQ